MRRGAVAAGVFSVLGAAAIDPAHAQDVLSVATFRVDATPPLGTALCDGAVAPATTIVDPLSARGVVLLGADRPIVLCAVDWVGIGNAGYDAWRTALAEAAGTSADRVALHTLHPHDAPGCDFAAEKLLASRGLGGAMFDARFARQTIDRAAAAVRAAIRTPRRVTHVGLGRAKVERVASNRRVLGADGKVEHVRYSSCRNEAAIAAPEGVIDPYVRLIGFFDGETPVAVLTYYATHPQSFYGQGGVSADFVGLARGLREATLPALPHIHFNGAGGNVAAGKYNDGSPPRRFELANRLAAGMSRAWDAVEKRPVSAADVSWIVQPVRLPLRDGFEEPALLATLDDADAPLRERIRAARDLVWARRCRAGATIDASCLRIGKAYVVHLPGELFVEYQLAAQQMRADGFVCMAAYGDYGPGYIGTAIAYEQGGYETSRVSRVGPGVEAVLTDAIRALLK